MMKNKKLELYLHIPFCVRKCLYCDFLSAPESEETKARYMQALRAEIMDRAAECEAYEISSIFVGGGTPSVVDAEEMAQVLGAIFSHYRVSERAEISIEVNPGTVDLHKLMTYKRAGINRLSIGLQSTNDEELARLGRIHTYSQFLDTYRMARVAGFTNINIDLMGALPGQNKAQYYESIQKVIELKPEHLSLYSLIVEEHTPFYTMYEQGELDLCDEDTEREMYWGAHELLQQNCYQHYEISNYAREGFACVHNLGYWTGVEYLGFGIGAASLFGEKRFQNTEHLQAYLENPCNARQEETMLSVNDRMAERMFLGLRTFTGVNKESFCREFGQNIDEIYKAALQKNIADGLLEDVNGTIRLTKRGIDLSNYVMAQFL